MYRDHRRTCAARTPGAHHPTRWPDPTWRSDRRRSAAARRPS